ncbi:SUMF1/EgtB/PvdO family nonheme iron enzyme [bacterium]|nr:SUMF1/EgtB/PvdO family nonheme iron enzyme [bacterium]
MGIIKQIENFSVLGKRTWKGKMSKLGMVVVKELDLHLDQAQKRLKELKSISLPFVANYYKVIAEQDRVFVVRSWIDGEQLQPKIDLNLAKKIVELIRDVSSKVIIYDLRPEHLILKDGKVYICDLGFNKKGTLPYCAPEQINREILTNKIAYYQLGAVLYNLLEDKTPPDPQILLMPNVEQPIFTTVEDSVNKNLLKLFEADPQERADCTQILTSLYPGEQIFKDEKTAEAIVEEVEPPLEDEEELKKSEKSDKIGNNYSSHIDSSIVALVFLPLLLGVIFVYAAVHYNIFAFLDENTTSLAEETKAVKKIPSQSHLPQSWISPKDGAKMILIPAGDFYYGPVPEAGGGVKPKVVHLNDYYIDRYEVTNRQFRKFVKETGYKAQGNWQKYAGDDRLDHPVIMVSYYDCEAYARWAGKRIPTAQEWEKAARGGDLRLYPWGGVTGDPQKLNCVESIWGSTSPVGSFPEGASPYGVEDMAGNVWEWVDSWFIPYDSNDTYVSIRKVVKGGSRTDSYRDCTVVAEKGVVPDLGTLSGSGFRCVYDPADDGSKNRTPKNKKKLRSLEELTPPKKPSPVTPPQGEEIKENIPVPDYTIREIPEGTYNDRFDYNDNYVPPTEPENPPAEIIKENKNIPEAETKTSETRANKQNSVDEEEEIFGPKPVIPDLEKGTSSGFVDEDKVNYYAE